MSHYLPFIFHLMKGEKKITRKQDTAFLSIILPNCSRLLSNLNKSDQNSCTDQWDPKVGWGWRLRSAFILTLQKAIQIFWVCLWRSSDGAAEVGVGGIPGWGWCLRGSGLLELWDPRHVVSGHDGDGLVITVVFSNLHNSMVLWPHGIEQMHRGKAMHELSALQKETAQGWVCWWGFVEIHGMK